MDREQTFDDIQALLTSLRAQNSDSKPPLHKSCRKKRSEDEVRTELENNVKPKRAPAKNPYNLFCSEMRAKVKSEKPDIKPNEMMKELGAKWKALSDTEKAAWKEKVLSS